MPRGAGRRDTLAAPGAELRSATPRLPGTSAATLPPPCLLHPVSQPLSPKATESSPSQHHKRCNRRRLSRPHPGGLWAGSSQLTGAPSAQAASSLSPHFPCGHLYTTAEFEAALPCSQPCHLLCSCLPCWPLGEAAIPSHPIAPTCHPLPLCVSPAPYTLLTGCHSPTDPPDFLARRCSHPSTALAHLSVWCGAMFRAPRLLRPVFSFPPCLGPLVCVCCVFLPPLASFTALLLPFFLVGPAVPIPCLSFNGCWSCNKQGSCNRGPFGQDTFGKHMQSETYISVVG